MAKKQVWHVGDFFLVPLSRNEEFAVGQVLAYEGEALGSVVCVFFGSKFEGSISDVRDTAVSIQYVTNHHLNSGRWKVLEAALPSIDCSKMILSDRRNGFVGVTIHGAGIVEDFLNAYFGYFPWDSYVDPEYFDKMLLPGKERPARPSS